MCERVVLPYEWRLEYLWISRDASSQQGCVSWGMVLVSIEVLTWVINIFWERISLFNDSWIKLAVLSVGWNSLKPEYKSSSSTISNLSIVKICWMCVTSKISMMVVLFPVVTLVTTGYTLPQKTPSGYRKWNQHGNESTIPIFIFNCNYTPHVLHISNN